MGSRSEGVGVSFCACDSCRGCECEKCAQKSDGLAALAVLASHLHPPTDFSLTVQAIVESIR